MMTVLKEGAAPRLTGTKSSTPPRHTDIIIIGGGLVWTAVAYFMKSSAERMVDVTVVERDYRVSIQTTCIKGHDIAENNYS